MMDYSVYLAGIDAFSVPAFVQYCRSLGLQIEMHPAFNLLEDAGFSPIHLTDQRFVGDGGSHDFLSGFELYISEYQHVLQSSKQATGFFQKLFKTKSIQETPFDQAVKDATFLIELRCGSGDSFEVLLAYMFGAYLVKCCGGVFDDPQTGQFYKDSRLLELEIADIITQLLEQAADGQLVTHEFEEWI